MILALQSEYLPHKAIVDAPLDMLTAVEIATARVEVGYQVGPWSSIEPYNNNAATALRRLSEEWGRDAERHALGWWKGLSFYETARRVAMSDRRSDADALRAGAEALRLLDAQPRTGVEVWLTPDRWRSPGPHPATVRRVRLHTLLADIEAQR